VKIPRVYEEYSSKDVIAMEYLKGDNILRAKKTALGKNTIRIITDSVYKMIFEDRFFHADLHPGNIFVNDHDVIFLDFGIVGRIDEELEKKLFALFSALVEPNLDKTAESLIDLHIGNEDVDEEILKRGIEDTLGDYYNQTLKEMNFEEIFYSAIDVARRSKIKLPPHLVLFGKSLVTMEGFCREIDPNFNAVQNAKPYVKKIMKQKLSYENLKKESKALAKQLYFELSNVPKYTKSFSRKFDILEKQVTGIDNNITEFNSSFKRMSKLLSYTFIFATFFIGGVLLINIPPLIYNYSVLSIFLFFLSLLFFFRLISYFND
jgi:ubiquinone biosynthesis protein